MRSVLVNYLNGIRNFLKPNRVKWFQRNTIYNRLWYSTNTPTFVNTVNKDRKLANGPSLKEFLIAGKNLPINRGDESDVVPYLDVNDFNGHGRSVFFEVYGCQMNVNDTEVVWSILKDNGYVKVDDVATADVVLVITCAIRERAETKVYKLNGINWLYKFKNKNNHFFPYRYGIA